MRLKYISLLLTFLCVSFISTAGTISPENLPMPMKSGYDHFVADPEHVLSDECVAQVNEEIAELRRNTTAELAVAILPDTDPLTIEEYALKLFENWGIGKKDKDNGALLIVSIGGRKGYIQTGYGMEGILPDATCHQLIRDIMAPEMKEGYPDAAVLNTVTAMCKIISQPEAAAEILSQQGEGENIETISPEVLWTFIQIVAFCFFIIALVYYFYIQRKSRKSDNYDKAMMWRKSMPMFWIFAFLSIGFGLLPALAAFWQSKRWRNKRIKCDNCGAKMKKLNEKEDNLYLDTGQDVEERLNTVDYDVWLCPQCGSLKRFAFKQKQNKYKECPNCHAIALYKKSDSVLIPPTTRQTGIGEQVWHCKHCNHDDRRRFEIPRKDDPALGAAVALGAAAALGAASRNRGGGGFGGGGFGGFGGGSTGGGGGGASW